MLQQLLPAARKTCAGIVMIAASISAAADSGDKMRIVSADATTTETLFALGVGEWVVARDSGSTYPESAQALPDIGTGHQLNAEAIIAMQPTMVIGRDRPMSQPGFHLLEAAGAKVIRLKEEPGIEAGIANIRRVARIVGRESQGEAIVEVIEEQLAALDKKIAGLDDRDRPRVLVVYLRPNATMLMGEDSNAVALARRAGAESAMPGMMGYKALNAEAVVAARPGVILTYTDGLAAIGGIEALLDQPGIAQTPAGRNKRIVALNDQLLGGFGPRMGEAALLLFESLFETGGIVIKE
jgi:iron complex transport system substrate-binding protein